MKNFVMGKTTNLNEKMLAPIKAIPLQTLGKMETLWNFTPHTTHPIK